MGLKVLCPRPKCTSLPRTLEPLSPAVGPLLLLQTPQLSCPVSDPGPCSGVRGSPGLSACGVRPDLRAPCPWLSIPLSRTCTHSACGGDPAHPQGLPHTMRARGSAVRQWSSQRAPPVSPSGPAHLADRWRKACLLARRPDHQASGPSDVGSGKPPRVASVFSEYIFKITKSIFVQCRTLGKQQRKGKITHNCTARR